MDEQEKAAYAEWQAATLALHEVELALAKAQERYQRALGALQQFAIKGGTATK